MVTSAAGFSCFMLKRQQTEPVRFSAFSAQMISMAEGTGLRRHLSSEIPKSGNWFSDRSCRKEKSDESDSRVMTVWRKRRQLTAGDPGTNFSTGLPWSRHGACSPCVSVTIRNNAATRIATVNAAATRTTGAFIVARSRCHHRALSCKKWSGKIVSGSMPESASPSRP
jgi:hypothetical protein